MTRRPWLGMALALLAGGSGWAAEPAGPDPAGPASRLFRQFSNYLDRAQADAFAIVREAERSAGLFITNGTLLIAPTQDSFLFEQWGRASGLGAVRKWKPEQGGPGTNDLLLLALEPTPDYPADGPVWVRQAAASGARVILFASPADPAAITKKGTTRFAASDFAAFIDNHTGGQPFSFQIPGRAEPRAIHLGGLMNMLNGLLFQGELAAACTLDNRMPVFWLSFAIDEPRGYPRAARLSRSIAPGRQWGEPVSFHPDLVVPAIPPGYVTERYLGAIRGFLRDLEGPLWPELERMIRETIAVRKAGRKVYFLAVGHAFPYEVPREEWNEVFVMLGPEWSGHMEPLKKNGAAGDRLLLLGMPTYPRQEVEQALARGVDVTVMCTEKPVPAPGREKRVRWVRAPWPIEDGAVRLEGYDIPILPVTGVMNTLIYYAVRSEVQACMPDADARPGAR